MLLAAQELVQIHFCTANGIKAWGNKPGNKAIIEIKPSTYKNYCHVGSHKMNVADSALYTLTRPSGGDIFHITLLPV